jgi:hypothetical protein
MMHKLVRVIAALTLVCLPVVLEAQAAPKPPGPLYNNWQIRTFLKNSKFPRAVTVSSHGTGDFKTYAAAVTYVAAQAPTNLTPWRIIVYDGAMSTAIEVPDHVVVYGPKEIRSGGAFEISGGYEDSEANHPSLEVSADGIEMTGTSITLQAEGLLNLTSADTLTIKNTENDVEISAAEGSAVILSSGDDGATIDVGQTLDLSAQNGVNIASSQGSVTIGLDGFPSSSVILAGDVVAFPHANGTALPGTCALGQIFLDLNTSARVCFCVASNSWKCAAISTP